MAIGLRQPRATLALTGLLLVVVLLASLATRDSFDIAGFTTPGSQSARALSELDRAEGFDPLVGMMILIDSPGGFRSSVARGRVAQLARKVARDPAVGAVQGAFGPAGLPVLLSRSARRTLLLIHFRSTSPDAVSVPIDRLRDHLSEPGLRLSYSGYSVGFLDANRAARSDLVRAELIAFPLLAALMLMVFRGVVAAAIPLLIGGFSVAGTFACLRLLAGIIPVSIYALDLALLLGLGLAVDYGLFLVSRYREEAAVHGVGMTAVFPTLRTAGRAVALSGCAVAGASAVLLIFRQEFIYSMGIAGVFVALFSALAALLLTPALLLIVGRRVGVPAGAVPQALRERSRWYRWPRWVMRHPVPVAATGALILVAAAVPASGLSLTFADQAAIPNGDQSKQVADIVDRQFAPNLAYPVNLAIQPAREPLGPVLVRLKRFLIHSPQVAAATPVLHGAGGILLQQVELRRRPYTPQSQAMIDGLRSLHLPISVGGTTAEFVDLQRSIDARAPWAAAIAAVATMAILFLLTGSAVLVIKALVFDALGLAAAFGLLVLIFQHGALGLTSLLGYSGPAAIDTTATVVIIATVFGLTTDYSVLLLSRIVEGHEEGAHDERAVATGIERSGPVITSAALLLVITLLALSTSRVFLVKELTIGQVLGIVIDVTFIRMLLVPSFMRILGPINWWAPKPLHAAYRWFGVVVGRAARPAGAPPPNP